MILRCFHLRLKFLQNTTGLTLSQIDSLLGWRCLSTIHFSSVRKRDYNTSCPLSQPLRRRRNLQGRSSWSNYEVNPICSRGQRANFISFPSPFGETQKRKEYSERRILGYTMEQMFDVVSDVERYYVFLPWCDSSHVRLRTESLLIADLVLGKKPLSESYTSNVKMIRPTFIKAESTEGRLFSELVTTWKFGPGLKSQPNSCMVEFYVSFEFRSNLQSKIADVFFSDLVRTMASAFYNEAQNRYGIASIPSRKIVIADGESK